MCTAFGEHVEQHTRVKSNSVGHSGGGAQVTLGGLKPFQSLGSAWILFSQHAIQIYFNPVPKLDDSLVTW